MVDKEQIHSQRVCQFHNAWSKEENMKTKIKELRRTIQYLQNQMFNAKLHIDKDPGMAKLIIDDALNAKQYQRS